MKSRANLLSLCSFLAPLLQQPQAPETPQTVVLVGEEVSEGDEAQAMRQRAIAAEAHAWGGSTVGRSESFSAFRFPGKESARRFLARIENVSGVTNAELSRRFELLSSPNDPWFPAQGNLQTIRAEQAWALLPSNAKEIPVAVIDTGACTAHPDLAGKILPGSMDFSGGPWGEGPSTSAISDPHGHGTHVCGIIAARANNGEGVVGVAPNAKVLPYQVFQFFGATTEAIVKAVHHARQKLAASPAKVMNFSLGGSECALEDDLDFFAEAVQAALDENFVVVAAAGNGQSCSGQNTNCGSDAIVYPAYFDEVISVANTTNWDDKQPASQWGWADVAAPGHLVLSTYPPNTSFSQPCSALSYQQLTGTSMSSPTVAGLAAMLFAVPGVDTNDKVRNLIFQSCVPVPLPADNPCGIPNPWVQHGRVDALNAVEAAYGLPPTPGISGKPKIVKLQGQKPWSKGYCAQLPFAPNLALNFKSPYYSQMGLHALALGNDGESLLLKSVEKNDSQKARVYLQAAIGSQLPATKIRLSARCAVKAGDGKPRRVGVRMFRYDKDEWTPEVAFELPASDAFQDLSFEFAQSVDKLVSPGGAMRFRIEGKWIKDSSQDKAFTVRIDRAKVTCDE